MGLGRNGFVVSFDAMIALLVLLSLFITITVYLEKTEYSAVRSMALKEIAMDSATVLEKSGKLEKGIKTNNVSGLRGFLNKLPFGVCAELRVYDESDLNTAAVSVLRPGCEKNFKDLATVKRSVLVRGGGSVDLYLAEVLAWYRVSE